MQQDNPLVFPNKTDQARQEKYLHYDKLYEGDHYEAFSIKSDEVKDRYAKLRYVVNNFAGLMTRVISDMLFGESITIDLKDKDTQIFIDALIQDNQLLTQLYESEIANSKRGDSCFKIRIGPRNKNDEKSSIIIEEFNAYNYFPVLEQDATRYTPSRDIIGVEFKRNNKTYMHREIHEPGVIYNEVWGYDPREKKLTSREDETAFGFETQTLTGVNRSLVFHIPNVRDGSTFFGTSDYKDLESQFFGLNNRMTSVDNILDKHSDPILAVPPGVLDDDGKVKKEALGMFEVDNETAGFNKPEYIIWNANLDSAFKQIDKFVEFLHMFSEIAPASTGTDKNGQLESGRALKLKLIATIRKRNRKLRYYDQAIKDMIETAQELAIYHKVEMGGVIPKTTERPAIKWPDGVINDVVEQTELEVQRLDAGISSRADSIARLDNISPDDAKKKVDEIDKESEPKINPPTNNLNGNGTGTAQTDTPPTPAKE